ncbi:MAG: 3-dehydroquinate synthase, partial [uncultured Gemmatimonadetes bacterium]
EHAPQGQGFTSRSELARLRGAGGVRAVRHPGVGAVPLLPGPPLRRGHRRPGGRAVRRAPVAHAARGGLPHRRVRLHLGRGAEDARNVGAGQRRHDGGRVRPRHGGDRLRGRRAGRPGRLRGGHLHARAAAGAGAHLAAGHDRRVGGRQDGGRHAGGQEPGGRLSPAALRGGGSGAAEHPARGAPAGRDGRGGEARRHRRRRVPGVDRAERRRPAGGRSRGAGAADHALGGDQGGDRGQGRKGKRPPQAAELRPHHRTRGGVGVGVHASARRGGGGGDGGRGAHRRAQRHHRGGNVRAPAAHPHPPGAAHLAPHRLRRGAGDRLHAGRQEGAQRPRGILADPGPGPAVRGSRRGVGPPGARRNRRRGAGRRGDARV